MLPAWVRLVCVDINPATVTKLMDRGSTQTVGIVSDAEPFLRSLAEAQDYLAEAGTDVPAPPMMLLFGAAAASIAGRRRFAKKQAA